MSTGIQRLKQLLAEALALPVAGRAAVVDRSCAGNAELRTELERLIKAHDSAGDFLEQSVVPPESDSRIETCGNFIGRYKLLQEIGEGGFGRVFMAEQVEPVHRKVALKIVKAGMDTREVIARFEAERQALALMEHPNIARVLDAGTTEAGRPYFVMELVRGVPITDYCDRERLSTEARLRLFVQICHAVQHAHQKGIIHRDLKPTNILVTVIDGEPVPKVIDFGVAKALGQKLTEKTLFTRFEEFLGTPAYMSPEQAEFSGVDVDTRSDIYALGMLLYELLTGVTPFDAETFRKVALDEVRRIIREVEPPKPSTRLRALGGKLTDVAQRRQVEPSALPRLMHGDLDWIVMKCLEKDRARRYETANSLQEDIQRHLGHEPVLASPPGTLYRARKFIRRHRMGVALSATAVAAVLVGLSAALVGFVEVRQERNHALAAEQQALKDRDRALRAEDAQLEILDSFLDRSIDDREAISLLEAGMRVSLEHLGATNKTHLRLLPSLARRYGSVGEWAKAREAYQTLIEAEPDNESFWWYANAAALGAGETNLAREISAGMFARFGSSHSPWVYLQVAQSLLLSSDSRKDWESASQIASLVQESQPVSPWSWIIKGVSEYRLGHPAAAEPLLDRAQYSSEIGPQFLAAYFKAMALQQQGRAATAQELLRKTNERFAPSLRASQLGSNWRDVCLVIAARGEAERLLLGREISPPVTANSLATFARERETVTKLLQNAYALAKEGRWIESAAPFAAALRSPAMQWETDRNGNFGGYLDRFMAMAFVRADDQASREELCRLLLNNLEKNQKPSPEDIERFVRVNCLSTSGMPADLQKRALELARLAETNNMPHPLPHWFALSLGIAEYRAGQYERAIELLHKAEQGKDSYGAQFTCRNEAMVFEALALKHLGREREARKILAQAHDSLAEPMKHRSLYNWRDLDYCKLALDEANKVFDKPASPGRKPPEPDSLPTWSEPTSSVWW